MRLGLLGGIDRYSTKHDLNEIQTGVSFEHEKVPLVFKLVESFRKNSFDKYASLDAYKNELMPSNKFSIITEIAKKWTNTQIFSWAEFGIPSNTVNFLKLSGDIYTCWHVIEDRFKISYDISSGILFPLTTDANRKYVHINDRFFLGPREYGFSYFSHTTPGLRPLPVSRRGDELIGDDLGTNGMFAQTLRFSWTNIPYLKLFHCAPTTYIRLSYYPKEDWMQIEKHLRLSSGLGLSFGLSPEVSVMIYYNLGNLLSQKGDYEREGFGLTLNLF